MNLAYSIARRLRIGRGTGSPAAVIIAVAGVALSLMVMEFTLAIVVGFKDGIRARLTGFDAQISVEAPLSTAEAPGSAPSLLEYSPALEGVIRGALPRDISLRLSLRQPGMLKTDDNFLGVVYMGQSTGDEFAFERSNITEGAWPDFSADSCVNDIVLSEVQASALGLRPGDKVFSTFIIDGAVKMRRHRVAALYRSNFGEYDKTVVYTSLRGLQRVVGADSMAASRIDIRGVAEESVPEAASGVQRALLNAVVDQTLDSYYPVTDITRTGALYFNWLALLDTNVTVIFILMLAVAGFTLVSSLFILILERVRMIGVLRALGASRGLVRNIFVDLGMRLVGMGMLIGNLAGIGLLLIQKYTHAVPLDPEMYYLSAVPVEIRPWAFVALNAGVAAASALILLVPARVAASMDPAAAVESE